MDRTRYDVQTTNDDDLYSGYNEFSSAFNTKDIEQDSYIQEALRTSYGNRPGAYTSRKTPKTSMRHITTSGRMEAGGTGFALRTATASREANRPMTAVRGAGYTSSKSTTFDPLNQGATMVSSVEKQQEKLEYRIKKMEESVMESIDESCLINARKDYPGALEKAKEASNREKALIRLHEEAGQPDQHNLDLTFLVLFNMAVQYTANQMYSEALNTYNVITRNRMFHNSNQLKINMANIYAHLGQFPKAIKIYRMALDQVPNTHKELRVNITHNIGILLVKMAQYHEACNSFEYIMQERPNFKAGLHRVLCYYAMGDKEKMKQSFKKMLEIQLDIDEDKYNTTEVDADYKMVLEVISCDKLRRLEKEKKQKAEHSVLTAAKLIANVIENNFTNGYNWCIDAIKNSKHESIAGDLEVNKAIMFLKQKNIPVAMETLKNLERRGSKLAAVAANNLAFIHFLEGDLDEAERLAEQAREADVYSPSPYVNLANCFFARQQFDKAKNLYVVALNNDPSCIEALYNLGVVHKELGEYEDSLRCFLKLQGLTSNHPPVLYQLASIHQALGDLDQAIEWYLQLLTVVPVDPSVFLNLGEIYDNDNEKQQAFHYNYEAYRYLPSKLSVLEWLGSYYVTHRVAEKAIGFYEKAALMQPNEAKWPLLIGSCYRRSGNYQQALQVYKTAHANFPDNIECLKLLVRLCSDLGLKETTEYALELKRVEKARDVRQRISSSRSGGSRKSSGRSSSPRTLPSEPNTPFFEFGNRGTSAGTMVDRVATTSAGHVPATPRPTTSFNDFDEFGEITDDLLPE